MRDSDEAADCGRENLSYCTPYLVTTVYSLSDSGYLVWLYE